MEEKKGVWRTVRGRRIFIPEGQDLYTAMVNSGKFKELKRGEYQKAKAEVDFKTKRDEYEQGTGGIAYTEKEARTYANAWKTRADETSLESTRDESLSKYRLWNETADKIKSSNKQRMKDADFKNQLYGKYYDNPIEADTTGLDGKHMTPKERAKAIDNANNWREQIKANNEARDKKAEEILSKRNSAEYKYHPDKFDDDYYGTYRETERRNASIKQEVPNEEYEFVESYGTYKEKKDRLAGLGNDWTGKEYTNDEFMEHLEDANWHTERRMLLDAKLTNAQLSYIKNRVKLSEFSAELDKAKTEKLIKDAKSAFPMTNTTQQKDYTKDVEDYYKNISVDNISADLEDRKNKMKNDWYAPNDKEAYQAWNEATEKYLGQRLSQESERLRNSTPKQRAEAINNANKETFTKSGKINYKAFGIESNPEDNFSDDGNKFSMYRLPNGLQMSVHRYDGDIYMSVRHPYKKDLEYKDVSQLPHYKDLDMYNGVRESSVDLNKLIKASDDFLVEFNELLKSKGIAPDTRTNLQRRKDNIAEKIQSTQKRLENWNNGGGYGSWRSQAREREKMAKELERLYELQNKLR